MSWLRRAVRYIQEARARQPWVDVPVAEETLARVAASCGLSRGRGPGKVLEFGCGTGRYLVGLRDRTGAQVFGVDMDAGLLARARSQGLPVARIDASRARLPFGDGSFDAVLSTNVIEHIPRPLYEQYLAEIHRVLKPDGRFAVGAPNYPIKRLFDLGTAIREPAYRWYFLLDDPSHVNRVSILGVERDLAPYFTRIRLEPSRLPFERLLPFLRHPRIRRPLRWLGYKFFGSCTRAEHAD
jgi:SAM-dependent methyltransferase